jgi:hypothetical protein
LISHTPANDTFAIQNESASDGHPALIIEHAIGFAYFTMWPEVTQEDVIEIFSINKVL